MPNTNPDPESTWLKSKVLPHLVVALILALAGASWNTYNAVQKLVGEQARQNEQIVKMQADIEFIRAHYVTQTQYMDTLKRVELLLENILLRSGIKDPKVKLTER